MKPTRSGSSRRRPMLSDVDYVLRKLDLALVPRVLSV